MPVKMPGLFGRLRSRALEPGAPSEPPGALEITPRDALGEPTLIAPPRRQLGAGMGVKSRERKAKDGRLTSARPADEAQVVELGDLVLHDGRVVAQFAAEVLVVAGAHGDDGAVLDVVERHHLEGHGQGLVGAPVGGQRRAQDVRRARLHQFARVLSPAAHAAHAGHLRRHVACAAPRHRHQGARVSGASMRSHDAGDAQP